ncbi:MAG TPA: haloalkane dehalogenase [Nitrospirae bacterium]|nr:haloalkane dehalogenase [Nitrospirota bacterium]
MGPMEISSEFGYKSNYIEVLGSKMHFVDEGEGDPIVFLHGNPTSSYLWRNIIPYLTPHARCIAPDLIGMGKSDKPDIGYRIKDHIKYMDAFIDALGLKNITFVVHDWGSSLGFDYAMRHDENIKGIAFMEAILRPFSWDDFTSDFKLGFKLFRTPVIGWLMICGMNVFVEKILPKATVRSLLEDEMGHYREPFKTMRDRKPLWVFPNEIPIDGEPSDVVALVESYCRWLQGTDLTKLLFYAHPGGLMKSAEVKWCRDNLSNLKTVDIGPGIHYLQEDNPHLIGKELAGWYKTL